MENFLNEFVKENYSNQFLNEAYDMYKIYLESCQEILLEFAAKSIPKDEMIIKQRFDKVLSHSALTFCYIGSDEKEISQRLLRNELVFSEKISAILVKYKNSLILELKDSLNKLDDIENIFQKHLSFDKMRKLIKLKKQIISSDIVTVSELIALKELITITKLKDNNELNKICFILNNLIVLY